MHIPEMVVLDTAPEVKQFKNGLEEECAVEFYTRDTINSIINCLNDKKFANYELREYVAQIEFGEFDAIEEEIGIDLEQRQTANLKEAERILELGLSIQNKIESMGLYLPDGSLPYHFDEEKHEQLQLPIGFIMLKRT